MAYGIQLMNSAGTAFFDTSSQTWNYLGQLLVVGGSTGSITIPEIALMTNIIFQRSIVSYPPNDQEGYLHSASYSGTTVNVSGGTVTTLVIILGQ